MDKRQHPRLPKSLPLEYKTGAKKSGRRAKGQGVLNNISLGGMFFKCEGPLKLESGHTMEFTVAIATSPTEPGSHETSLFKGQGTIVRIEPPEEGSPFFGIAVQFSQPLTLAQVLKAPSQP